MMSKKFLITSAASVLLCGGVVFAQNQVVEYVQQPNVVYVQAPVVNISNRHGNLRSAQQNIVSAYQKIQNAQAANDGQLGGHAQRAKDLLAQADEKAPTWQANGGRAQFEISQDLPIAALASGLGRFPTASINRLDYTGGTWRVQGEIYD